MKKIILVMIIAVIAAITCTACGKFTCELCGVEKNGAKHSISLMGEEAVVCDDCYLEIKEYREEEAENY